MNDFKIYFAIALLLWALIAHFNAEHLVKTNQNPFE